MVIYNGSKDPDLKPNNRNIFTMLKNVPAHLYKNMDTAFEMIEVGDIVNFDTVEGQSLCGKKAKITSKSHSKVAGGTNPFDHISFWAEKENGDKVFFTVASTLQYDTARKGVPFKGLLRNGSIVSGLISGFGA